MYFDAERKKSDIFFMQQLSEISNKSEISKVIGILDDEKGKFLTDRENEYIESFFLKIVKKKKNKLKKLKNPYKTNVWKDTLVDFCDMFDIDMDFLISRNRRLYRKICCEIKLKIAWGSPDFIYTLIKKCIN